ncbi:MAG: hypothetical protein ACRYFX_08695 [Janthinobacterium lividum]
MIALSQPATICAACLVGGALLLMLGYVGWQAIKKSGRRQP